MNQRVAVAIFLGLLTVLLLFAGWDIVRDRSGSRLGRLLLVLALVCGFGALGVYFL